MLFDIINKLQYNILSVDSSIADATELAKAIETLSTFQLFLFLFIVSQLGLMSLLAFLILSSGKTTKEHQKMNDNMFKINAQLFKTNQKALESFDKQQEKDWRRTQILFRQQSDSMKLIKSIYYILGTIKEELKIIKQGITNGKTK